MEEGVLSWTSLLPLYNTTTWWRALCICGSQPGVQAPVKVCKYKPILMHSHDKHKGGFILSVGSFSQRLDKVPVLHERHSHATNTNTRFPSGCHRNKTHTHIHSSVFHFAGCVPSSPLTVHFYLSLTWRTKLEPSSVNKLKGLTLHGFLQPAPCSNTVLRRHTHSSMCHSSLRLPQFGALLFFWSQRSVVTSACPPVSRCLWATVSPAVCAVCYSAINENTTHVCDPEVGTI